MALALALLYLVATGQILFLISDGQEVNVKSKKRHFWKNWNEWNSNPGALHDGGPPSW